MLQAKLSPCRQPFLYLTLALVSGILVDRSIQPPGWVGTTLAGLSVILAIKFLASRADARAGIAICLSFFSAGTLLSRSERTGIPESALGRRYELGGMNPDAPVVLIGTLARFPEPAPAAFYLDVEAEGTLEDSAVAPASGHVLLLVPVPDKDSRLDFERLRLKYRSRVRVFVSLEQARSYKNPGSLNFNDFLERRGYQLKGTVKSLQQIERLGDAPANPLLDWLFRFRIWVIGAIDDGVSPKLAGTLKAMLLDNRYYLDRSSAELLRRGGTFHVISISGMHVGIIAVLLLGGLPGPKPRSRVWVSLVVVVLWGYAIMVGLAPPVTRATVMISVGLVGPLLFRRGASLNTVALAALVMLALKPSLVEDPGFQLSFLAVAGIVCLALPVTEKLRRIGEWRPASTNPHPPSCSGLVRWLAEMLFWDERAFRDEMRHAPVSFRVEKARSARLLGRLRVQRFIRFVAVLVITSSAIQLSTLPLTVMYFNRVVPIGLLLNITAGLLTTVLMSAGVLAVVAGALFAWLGGLFEALATAAHFLLVNSIVPFTGISGASFRVAHYEGRQTFIYALYYLPLVLSATLFDRWQPVEKRNTISNRIQRETIEGTESTRSSSPAVRLFQPRRRGLRASRWCAIGLAICLVAVLRPVPPSPTGKLEVYFLDVGQGDSAFIVFPGGATMLVDGGGELEFGRHPGAYGVEAGVDGVGREREVSDLPIGASFGVGESVVSRFIWSTGRTRVDYLLATHGHADHIRGLFSVAENFRVGETIVGSMPAENSELDQLSERVGRQGVPMARVGAGERFLLEGVEIQVLWPPRDSPDQTRSGNDDSIVLRLVYGSTSVLLAGDIEQHTEESLIRSGVNLRADVLKVPHHGSRTSSGEAFIDAVKPTVAVVSVGERSRFGHPHAEVVRRYLTRQIRMLQTGRDGMVTIASNGAVWQVASRQ